MKSGLIPKPTSTLGAVVELLLIVAMAIGLALGIQAFLVKPYQIPSPSMVPTLVPGERVLVNRLSYTLGGEPSIGDIVVFHPPNGADTDGPGECAAAQGPGEGVPCAQGTPEQSEQTFIKRIVAGPGDTLYIEDGHPVVNGEKMTDEPYIRPCSGGICNLQEPIEIPPDHYFMLGDNRGSSKDSRYWGPVPEDWILGKAFFTYWPLDEVGLF